MAEETKPTDLEQARKLVDEEKQARIKNVTDGLNNLLTENKCSLTVKVGEFSQNTVPQISIVISTND